MKNIEGTLCFSPKFSAFGRKNIEGTLCFWLKKNSFFRPSAEKCCETRGVNGWGGGVNGLEYDWYSCQMWTKTSEMNVSARDVFKKSKIIGIGSVENVLEQFQFWKFWIQSRLFFKNKKKCTFSLNKDRYQGSPKIRQRYTPTLHIHIFSAKAYIYTPLYM